jgi:hypothetical protein
VERELARVFDAHGVRWLYEPHTLVLEHDPDGMVREAFTPDFYLPDLGLYVECTVARQRLTEPQAAEGPRGPGPGTASMWRCFSDATSRASPIAGLSTSWARRRPRPA